MAKAEKTNTPTLEGVEQQEGRAEALEREAEELSARERDLTQQIAHCDATGADDKLDALTKERRNVRELRADIGEALPVLREQIAKNREAAGKVEAEKRLSQAIPRAFGSLVNEYAEDGKRLVEAARSYAAAKEQFNARFLKLRRLEVEQRALTDRFGLTASTLPTIIIPARHPAAVEAHTCIDGTAAFLDHGYLSPATERDEHHLRTRRTYDEIAGTPGGEIIKAAGPKPWPDLTPKQREIVASRAREKEEEAATVARFGADAARSTQRARLG